MRRGRTEPARSAALTPSAVRHRRVTEPENQVGGRDAPGVQLAAILALDPYGPVVDGHTVGGYRSARWTPS